ncbi:MAG: hypothetical protein H6Q52_1666, partial [Deltaproteobacteria bacterium]|nr:hypothetical protein [Deltaproteobacteria bacterium]
VALMGKTACNELGPSLDDGRRSRTLQSVRLPELLKAWILG